MLSRKGVIEGFIEQETSFLKKANYELLEN